MIVVTAPTGQIGRQVLDNLLDSAEKVRVIARDPARLAPQVRERVEIVQGSHSDLGVVTEAFAGADSVFWLVPPNPQAESIQGHILDFVRPVCEAINSQDVGRVIGVSTLGRGVTRNAGQVSATFAMDDMIESTGVSYRSLCPPAFMENVLPQVETIKNQGAFFSPVPGDLEAPSCATRDIAATAATLLLDDSWTGQASVPILGPDLLSNDDMARIMSEVLEWPVRFEQVSGDAYKARLIRHGMSEAWAQGMVDIASAADQGGYDDELRTPESAAPTNFRLWCEDVLKPAVLA